MSKGSTAMGPDTVQAGSDRPARRFSSQKLGELIFAGVLLALGVYALAGVFSIRIPIGVHVGPRVFPVLVAVILLASAVAVLVQVLRGKLAEAEDGEDVDRDMQIDWLTLLKLVGLVVAHIVLIPLVGWAPAAAVLFGGAAWTLGAKKWWMALLVGCGLGLVLQIVFGELLGLSLPWGPLLGWLGDLF